MVNKDGGPAFPVIGAPGAPEDYGGMSLRDYFAGQAIVALMSNKAWVRGLDEHCAKLGLEFRPELVRSAYETADVMLRERQK